MRALVKTVTVKVTNGAVAMGFTNSGELPRGQRHRDSSNRPGTRIDAGSASSYTDSIGDIWGADSGFVGGTKVNRGAISIANTTDPALYQTEHHGMSSFSTAVPNGNYVVYLHFAETSKVITGAGQRIFNVSVNGVTINGLDVYAQAGGKFNAMTKSVTVKVTSGTLPIAFTTVVNNPEINAIEVVATN